MSLKRLPWNLHQAWFFPWLMGLVLFSLLGATLSLQHRIQQRQRPLAFQPTSLGRSAELQHALFHSLGRASTLNWKSSLARGYHPADQAVFLVLAAEDLASPKELAIYAHGLPGEFTRIWIEAYQGKPAGLFPREKASILGNGYALKLLEARWVEGSGSSGVALREQAHRDIRPRVLTVGLMAIGGILLGLLALGFLFLGAFKRPMLLDLDLSGRGLVFLLFAWFSGLLLSGMIVGSVLQLHSGLKALALPLQAFLHAGVGIFLALGLTGESFSSLWRRLNPGNWKQGLKLGILMAGLAPLTVYGVSWCLQSWIPQTQPVQRELVELIKALRGPIPLVVNLLTVSLLAPAFEEWMFRGLVLPSLARRWGWSWALLVSSLLFGLIHLEPLGMPALSALGMVLGWSYLRSGSLIAPILIHGLWNASVWMMIRWVI